MFKKTAISSAIITALLCFSAIPATAQEHILQLNAPTIDNSSIVSSSELKSLQKDPLVTFDIINKSGQAVKNASVTVISISDNDKIVFQGSSDDKGQISFNVTLSEESKRNQKSDVATGVYEVYYVNPIDNEMGRDVFSAQFVKTNAKISTNDHQKFKEERTTKKTLKFEGNENKRPNKKQVSETSLAVTQAAGTGPNCVPGGGTGYTICTDSSYDYSASVKIGTVNVGSNETATINFTSNSMVKLTAGYKTAETSPWAYSGEYSVTTDSGTTAEYTINGKCLYSNGTYCDVGVDYYGYYKYNAKKKTVYYYGSKAWEEYTVTPVQFNGPDASKLDYYITSKNGILVSTAQLDSTVFSVGQVASGTKYYSAEKSFSQAVSLKTIFGTFSAGATTGYKNATSYKWSTTSSVIYYHYKKDGIYYVTH